MRDHWITSSRSLALLAGYALLLVGGCAVPSPRPGPPRAADSPAGVPGTVRKELTIRLGDFDSRAQLTYPGDHDGPVPALLLIHGAGPYDRDFTFGADADGRPISAIGRDLAEFLASRGFAVMRYDKRYVRGPDDVDARFFSLDLRGMLHDAETMLQVMREHPRIDSENLFVYGWSEGSVIAGQLAVRHDDVKGMVVQAPVVHSFRESLALQFEHAGLPYLREHATDGKLDLAAAEDAISGDAGVTATFFARLLLDPAPEAPCLNPHLDPNSDGWIDLEGEMLIWIQRKFGESEWLGIYADDVALPGLLELAPELDIPLLILQGEQDGHTPARLAVELHEALPAPEKATLHLYPGLGHSLGPASAVTDDRFLPIAPPPLGDLARWLEEHVE